MIGVFIPVDDRPHRVPMGWVIQIPTGLTIDHLCRNTSCGNPDHLEAVPGGVNTLRGYSPPARNARKAHCPHGHPLSDGNLYRYPNPKDWRECRQCRAEAERRRSHRDRRGRIQIRNRRKNRD